MKNLSYLEIMPLVRELKKLSGARVENVYQMENKLVLKIYKQNTKHFLKIHPGAVYLSDAKENFPDVPPHFSMFLRKHLKGAFITDVSQPSYERIIKIDFRKRDSDVSLYLELFGDGNVILCDSDGKIMIPLKPQTWKDRILRAHREYSLPPSEFSPDEIDFNKFKTIISQSEKKEIVRALASGLRIGGTYAEEICALSEIKKDISIDKICDEKMRIIFKNFTDVFERAKDGKISANIVYENKKPVDVQPFELCIHKDLEKKQFKNFNEAIDDFFPKPTIQLKEPPLKEIMKNEMLLKQHENYLTELFEKSALLKKQADFIYQNKWQLEFVFKLIKDLKQEKEWNEILPYIDEEKNKREELAIVEKIFPDKGTLLVRFETPFEIDFTIPVTENANNFYQTSKKLASKTQGVKKAIQDTKDKIEKLRSRELKVKEKISKPIVEKKKEWYEKFHWFFTSENRLAIGGRDATQNEILIKKYVENEDIVFHGDVHGSPFVVLKKGMESTEEEKKETAIFTLCHSKAWQNKRLESVYWVNPEQVSKKAPSGEYISKGSFMIHGRKNYVTETELRYGVGVNSDFSAVSGPVDVLRKRAKYYAVLIPGDWNKDETAKRVRKFMKNVSREEDREKFIEIDIEELKEHCLEGSSIFGAIE